ncbi:MAG: glycoside hydrolase family 32 protein [Amnibacterium sp.]
MPRARPAAHFTPRSGWINDPLGVTWHDGRYHVFVQHVPDGVDWRADISWGHATSEDLVHWAERPVALVPGEGDGGVWSGCLVLDGEDATILYTSVDADRPDLGRIRSARPLDAGWSRWEKGPVVADPAQDAPVTVCRDPFVVRDGDGWRMLVAAALPGRTAAVLTYRSSDLVRWTSDGVLAERAASETDPIPTGELWECPQLLRFGDTAVLLVSVWNAPGPDHVAYAVGSLRDGRFVAGTWRRLTWGAPYAPTVFADRNGEPCILFWIRGVAGDGWAGALSVPHRLRLVGDRLVLRPHPAVATAGASILRMDGVEPGRTVMLQDAVGDECARITTGRDGVTVLVPGHRTATLPLTDPADVVVLADGPVLEVATGVAVFAAPIAPASALTVVG